MRTSFPLAMLRNFRTSEFGNFHFGAVCTLALWPLSVTLEILQ